MKIKKTIGERVFTLFNVSFMLIIMIMTLYPLIHVMLASFSNSDELMRHEGIILRSYGFTFDAYMAVFKNPMIAIGYVNTVIIVVAGVSINILLTSLAAYVLSRKNVLWNNSIMIFIIFTMFFSGGLIPFYLTVKGYHLDNSLWALIIPGAVSTFNMIIMRTSFMGIPDSLEESAKLDGAGHFTILFRIILPLSSAIIAVMVLYYGVGHWNSWFNAMLFIRKRELYPLQAVLREILILNQTSDMSLGVQGDEKASIGETIKYAVIVVATLPVLMLYPFLQKYFVKGVLIGAVKG